MKAYYPFLEKHDKPKFFEVRTTVRKEFNGVWKDIDIICNKHTNKPIEVIEESILIAEQSRLFALDSEHFSISKYQQNENEFFILVKEANGLLQ